MTREEALQRIVDNNFAGEYGFDLQILIDCMAAAREIILNSQFSVEDCISREAVLALKTPVDTMTGWSGYMIDALDVEQLPPVTPKPKTDEPMQVDLEGDGYADGELVYDYGKCPKCGWDFEYGDKDWEEPYCCHCGQKLHWFESEEQE